MNDASDPGSNKARTRLVRPDGARTITIAVAKNTDRGTTA